MISNLPSPAQQKAAQLVLRRKAVRSSMAAWGESVGYAPALHHRFIIDKLEAQSRGEIRKLALFLPPGSAKSTWGTILFVPWYLAQKPGRIILSVSHSADKAREFGRASRNLVEANSNLLGFALTRDSKAADEWSTTNKGHFYCAGAGTGIAGNRASHGSIDDPFGKKEDADSKLIRDKIWNWYNADFKFRLLPGATQTLIQTRWHEDDLAGRILASPESKEWNVISIPLIAEVDDPLGRMPGEPLWPEFFDAKHIEDMKSNEYFIPMCQQRPTPESGELFKKEWIEDNAYHSPVELPSDLRYYVGSDHAVSKREHADRTCVIPVGVDSRGDIWVLPTVYWPRLDRPLTTTVVDTMLDICERYSPHTWWAGRDHITGSLLPFIEREAEARHTFIPFEEQPSIGKKRERATPMLGFFKRGRVHMPAFTEWYADARDEMLRFDAGTHDDFVDALSCLGQGLHKQAPAVSSKEPDQPIKPPVITLGWVKQAHKRYEQAQAVANIDN